MNSANVYQSAFDKTQKAKASRLSFGEELAELGSVDSRIVVLDADLSKSTRTDIFAGKFADRFFNMGIAEANLIGTAAGLANAGMIPFAASFGCFLTGRFDQIRMSVAFAGANVKLVGTHAGVGIGEDGHSQMALEDLTLMRVLPGMTVFQPADDYDTRSFLKWSVAHKGPVYMRLTRQNLPALARKKDAQQFSVGKWQLLTEGNSESPIVVFATGSLVGPSIEAAEKLSQKLNASIEVVNANWIQPYDEFMLSEFAERKAKLWVSVEDHYVTGGLGGLISEWMASRGCPARLLKIGVSDFGQSGTPEVNSQAYGFTPEGIFEKISLAFENLNSR